MQLDVSSLQQSMTDSVRTALGDDRWSAMGAVAEIEFRRLAQALEDVNQLLQAGKIDAKRAMQIVRMHRNSAESVLTTVKGLGVRTGRQAIAAAADAAGLVVNRLVGFDLISTSRAIRAQFKAGKDL